MFLLEKLRNYKAKKNWRKINQHNFTTISFEVDPSKIVVGNGTYGELIVYNVGTESKLKIGHYCSIGPNVAFLPGSDHELNNISTYPFKTLILNEGEEASSKGDIIVDDDVWIGYGAIILSGVHIGQGAVIGAGAVINKDVPPYAIVGGVPAKVIKYRFDSEQIGRLLKLDFGKLDKDMIRNHISELYGEFDVSSRFEWMI